MTLTSHILVGLTIFGGYNNLSQSSKLANRRIDWLLETAISESSNKLEPVVMRALFRNEKEYVRIDGRFRSLVIETDRSTNTCKFYVVGEPIGYSFSLDSSNSNPFGPPAAIGTNNASRTERTRWFGTEVIESRINFGDDSYTICKFDPNDKFQLATTTETYLSGNLVSRTILISNRACATGELDVFSIPNSFKMKSSSVQELMGVAGKIFVGKN